MAAICQFTPISYPEKHSIKITYNKLGYVIWRICATLRKSTLVLGSCWFEIGVLSDQHHLILHFLYLFICLSTIWWFHEITIDFFLYFSCYVRWDLLIFIFQLRKSKENKWLHLLQLVFGNVGMYTLLHGDAISYFLEFRFFGAVTSLSSVDDLSREMKNAHNFILFSKYVKCFQHFISSMIKTNWG